MGERRTTGDGNDGDEGGWTRHEDGRQITEDGTVLVTNGENGSTNSAHLRRSRKGGRGTGCPVKGTKAAKDEGGAKLRRPVIALFTWLQ